MPLIRDRAIVLKRLDFRESSQVIAVLTREHGMVRLIAKGSRRSTKKRFNPGIDLLESGELVLSVRHVRQEALANLTEWKQGRAFLGLRDRLERLNAALYAADAVARLTEDWDPHPGLFDALFETLEALSGSDCALRPITAFQRALLNEVGLSPCLDACVGCGGALGASPDIYFTSFEGGLICRDCEPARVEKRLVTCRLENLQTGVYPTDADLFGAFDLFDYHLSHLIGRAPAAAAFLKQLSVAHRQRPI